MIAGKYTVKFLETSYPLYYVTEESEAIDFCNRLVQQEDALWGIDTETAALPEFKDVKDAALNPHLSNVRLLQIFTGRSAFVFDMKDISYSVFTELLEKRRWLGHNSKFDLQFFYKNFKVSGMDIGCTMLAAKLIFHALSHTDSGLSASLRNLVNIVFKSEILKEEQTSDWSAEDLNFSQVEYSALDAICTLKIGEKLAPKLINLGMQKIYSLYKEAQHPIVSMQLNGMKIDSEKHAAMNYKWIADAEESKAELIKLTGLEKITPATMAEYLTATLDEATLAVWPRTETGKLQTDANAFVDFGDLPVVKPFARYQKASKLVSAFGWGLKYAINPVTKRVHSQYNMSGARTGRLSCSAPNSQQYPREKEFRSLVIPERSCSLVVADYSQIEVRVVTEYSHDAEMLKVYRTGKDLYRYTAAKLNGIDEDKVTKEQRQGAKALCFSGDTEVLTPNGWCRFDVLEEGTEVAQYSVPPGVVSVESNGRSSGSPTSRFSSCLGLPKWDGQFGEISFVVPNGYIKQTGKTLLSYEDRKLSLMATPDHDIVTINAYGQFEKKKFAECTEGTVRSTLHAGYLRREAKESAEFTRILAAVVADGSFTSASSVRFGFVKRRKARRLIELFKKYGIKIEQRSRKQVSASTGIGYTFHITDKDLVYKLLTYTDISKNLGWNCLTDIDAYAYLNEAQFWDGYKVDHEDSTWVTFSTIRKQTADVMQAMCVTSGVVSSISKDYNIRYSTGCLYTLNYSLTNKTTFRPRLTPEAIEGLHTVYCVGVPSGNIVIRHHGKVSIQGNCLGLMYGLGADKFSFYANKTYGVKVSKSEARQQVADYRHLYSGLRAWQQEIVKDVAANGYIVTTMMGKKRKLDPENAYGASLNTPIQGSSAEIMLHAMVHLWNRIKHRKDFRLIASVHDELLMEVPAGKEAQAKKYLEDSMIAGYKAVFPNGQATKNLVEAHSGKNWAEAKA